MGAKLRALIMGLTRIGGMIGLIIIAFMVLATMADVTMRYFFHRPIAGVIEYCGILLPVMVFLGPAATQQASGHIGVTLFLYRLSPRGRAFQEIINRLLCLAFALALASQTWKGAMYSYAIREYLWRGSRWPMRCGRRLSSSSSSSAAASIPISCSPPESRRL